MTQNLEETIAAPGQVLFGEFRVREVIGRGGMGLIAAADYIKFDERVAISRPVAGLAFEAEDIYSGAGGEPGRVGNFCDTPQPLHIRSAFGQRDFRLAAVTDAHFAAAQVPHDVEHVRFQLRLRFRPCRDEADGAGVRHVDDAGDH